MTTVEYWKEFLSDCLWEHGVYVSKSQLDGIAKDIAIASDNQHLAFPTPEVSHVQQQIRDLQIQLEIERGKIICPTCKGRGHDGVMECHKCHGRKWVSR